MASVTNKMLKIWTFLPDMYTATVYKRKNFSSKIMINELHTFEKHS